MALLQKLLQDLDDDSLALITGAVIDSLDDGPGVAPIG